MNYDETLTFIFRCPTKIIFGNNSSKEVGAEVAELGCNKAIIITDKDLIKTKIISTIEKGLGTRYAGTFSNVEPDSGFHIVNEGTEYARSLNADCIISVGGGSAIDTGKGISILLKEGGKLEDYQGVNQLRRPQTPHIVIPTTSGTGSEVTNVAVIRDLENNRKLAFLDNYIYPNTAILDPSLTLELPLGLTSATAMDAMCHAIEAIHSNLHNPISDALALHAITLIKDYLPIVMKNPKDLLARGNLLIASTLAGASFSNSMVGIVHAIAHSIGAISRVHHGLANSILLPYCMLYNLEEMPALYTEVSKSLGVYNPNVEDIENGKRAANFIWELTKLCNLPQKLSEANVKREDLEKIAELSLSDGAIINNPRLVLDKNDIISILESAF